MKNEKMAEEFHKILKKIIAPAQSMDMADFYLKQIIAFWEIWIVYKNLMLGFVEKYECISFELIFYLTMVLLLVFHFVFPFFVPYYIEKKEVMIKIPIFLFEYDTYYQKKFLKDKYKPYRKIMEIFTTYFWIVAAWVLIKRPSLDLLAFLYFELLIYNLFAGHTKEEYEEKLVKIPYISSERGIKKYEDKISEEKELVLWSEKESFRLPEVQGIREYEDKQKNFLYKNAGNLDHFELMRHLLNEESVLTDTPFYKDMGVALFFPLHEALIKGKKIIFFIGGNESQEEITAWIREGLKSVTRMEEFWKIVNFQEYERNWDIGVITSDDMSMLYEMKTFLSNPAGFVIVFLHPEQLLVEAQNELYEWGYLLSMQQVPPVYVIIERAILGLLDLVSHIFCSEFKYVSKGAEPARITSSYVLDGTRDDLYKKIVGISPDMGIEAILAKFADEAGIRDICWMAGSKMPFYDINSIKKQHTSLRTEDLIVCKQGVWSLPKEKCSFQILNDEINNMWEMLRQAKTRGKDIGIVSIVSNEYLLLAYMYKNREVFLDDIYAIPAMAPNFSESTWNRNVILLKMLLYRKMNAEEIRAYRSRYVDSENLCEDSVLSESELSEIESEIEKFLDSSIRIRIKKYDKNTYYIVNSPQIERLCEELTSPAVYFDEEEKTKTFLGGKHRWQIEQNYLPGQTVVLNGKVYRVKGREKIYIDGKWEEVLTVRRYRSGMIYRVSYYQDREYDFKEEIQIEEYQEERFGLKWTMLSIPFSVRTKGYYTLSGKEKEIEYTKLSIPVDREYTDNASYRKNVIALKFQKEDNYKLRRTVAIIFSEVLKTLFPEGYPYIAVLVPESENGADDKSEYEYLCYKMNKKYADEQYDMLILEDSRLELGILSMINKHMEHILRIIYSYSKWWNEEEAKNISDSDEQAKKWKLEMEGMEGFVQALDAVYFGTLSQYREEKKVPNMSVRSVKNYCRCCWKEISGYSKKCEVCKKSFLTKEDYDEIVAFVTSFLSVEMGIQGTFGIEIVVENRMFQYTPIKRVRGNRNKFICTPHIEYHAVMAYMVRELVCCWIENTLSKQDKIQVGTEEVLATEENVKYAVGDWYELCFMYAFKLIELMERRKAVLFSKNSVESEYLQKLCTNWKIEEYKRETPLKKYI